MINVRSRILSSQLRDLYFHGGEQTLTSNVESGEQVLKAVHLDSKLITVE